MPTLESTELRVSPKQDVGPERFDFRIPLAPVETNRPEIIQVYRPFGEFGTIYLITFKHNNYTICDDREQKCDGPITTTYSDKIRPREEISESGHKLCTCPTCKADVPVHRQSLWFGIEIALSDYYPKKS